VPLENDLNIAIKAGVKNFTTDEFLISILTNSLIRSMLELVNQYPQEFDDAIPFIPGFTLGILSRSCGSRFGNYRVNCKKRIVLPWRMRISKRIEISMELQQTVLKSNCY
jgi:hypothetical protein